MRAPGFDRFFQQQLPDPCGQTGRCPAPKKTASACSVETTNAQRAGVPSVEKRTALRRCWSAISSAPASLKMKQKVGREIVSPEGSIPAENILKARESFVARRDALMAGGRDGGETESLAFKDRPRAKRAASRSPMGLAIRTERTPIPGRRDPP